MHEPAMSDWGIPVKLFSTLNFIVNQRSTSQQESCPTLWSSSSQPACFYKWRVGNHFCHMYLVHAKKGGNTIIFGLSGLIMQMNARDLIIILATTTTKHANVCSIRLDNTFGCIHPTSLVIILIFASCRSIVWIPPAQVRQRYSVKQIDWYVRATHNL